MPITHASPIVDLVILLTLILSTVGLLILVVRMSGSLFGTLGKFLVPGTLIWKLLEMFLNN